MMNCEVKRVSMREILFRGKRVDNGEWVEGFYACVLDTHYIITGRFDSLTNGIINSEAYKVDPSTVGRFTGLTDCNGVKIFGGDIIRWHDNTELSVGGQIAEVCFGKYRDAESVFDDIYPLGFTYTVEKFRAVIQRAPAVLMASSATHRSLVRFGLIKHPDNRTVQFYFERNSKND